MRSGGCEVVILGGVPCGVGAAGENGYTYHSSRPRHQRQKKKTRRGGLHVRVRIRTTPLPGRCRLTTTSTSAAQTHPTSLPTPGARSHHSAVHVRHGRAGEPVVKLLPRLPPAPAQPVDVRLQRLRPRVSSALVHGIDVATLASARAGRTPRTNEKTCAG